MYSVSYNIALVYLATGITGAYIAILMINVNTNYKELNQL